MIKKPDVLNDKEIARALETLPMFRGKCLTAAIDNIDRVTATAQRDADVEYYEPLIKEMYEVLKLALSDWAELGKITSRVEAHMVDAVYKAEAKNAK